MLSLDYSRMLQPAVAGGVVPDALERAEEQFAAAHRATWARHARDELGFFDLPDDTRLLAQSLEAAQKLRQRGTRDVVVLGIGGSALGPIALRTALRPPAWNSLTEGQRDRLPRLHVLDNIDAGTMRSLLDRLELDATVFVTISKSGGTAETMAQYLIARDRIERARLRPRDHLLFITDPERGALRAIAQTDGIQTLDIPPNVGGRFSVLSPVGMLPAAAMGIDIRQILAGASEMRERCRHTDPLRNPAGIFAMLQWLADARHGRRMHVFMPYADSLRDMAAWFVQLWAESLGKTRADGSHTGPTPVAAVGATDQHSQMQLFMEGPQDKTVTFLTIANPDGDLEIPRSPVPDLSYLGGHGLAELLSAEQQASAAALAKHGRPSMTLTVDRVDPWHIGGLLMLLEAATAYAGELYGVNAFDQPGVELGKQFTYALFGRAGSDAVRRDLDGLMASGGRHVV
jgi:glucose-6-phosphate isomerase